MAGAAGKGGAAEGEFLLVFNGGLRSESGRALENTIIAPAGLPFCKIGGQKGSFFWYSPAGLRPSMASEQKYSILRLPQGTSQLNFLSRLL